MNEVLAFWADWLKPSAGLPTVQWSVLLALAAASGHLMQRFTRLPKVVGYSLVGALAGLAGFSGAAWPLQGIGLFLLELGLSVVLFEAGGRVALRWFRHNPMVLVQSILEAVCTYFAVYFALTWMGVAPPVADMLAIVALVASPAVLMRVVMDARATGPVTERAIVLATLSALYTLAWGSAKAGLVTRPTHELTDTLFPVAVVLGLSVVVAAALALTLRTALRVMNPTSESMSMLVLALIAAGTALAAHFGGSAPLAALLGGMLLKQLSPRPWTWPRQLGTAASLLTMLMFVLVSVAAAQAEWSAPVAGLVLVLVGARLLAKVVGIAAGNLGSGASWTQALWVGCAMAPTSAVALLVVSQFMAAASPGLGQEVARIALPAILLMEMCGAAIATYAIYRAGEGAKPWEPTPPAPASPTGARSEPA